MAVEASVQIGKVGRGNKLHKWRQVRLRNKEWDSDKAKWKGCNYVKRQ